MELKKEVRREDVEAVEKRRNKKGEEEKMNREDKKEIMKAFGKSFAVSFLCGMAIGILSAAINEK